MNAPVFDLGERHKTFPKSVQPGIPKLGALKAGWKRVKIGELFRVVNRPCKLSDANSYRLVTVKRSRGGIEPRGDLLGAEIAVKSQFFIEEDDFLISKRQIVHGACAIVPAEFSGSIVSNEYAVLRCKPLLDLGFLRQLIHSTYFQETCFHSSLGVHVEKMIFSTPDWFKWKIDIPEIEEQREIAGFLGAVDERIKLMQRRRDALARYKAGLMQRLFDQSLRFTRDDGTAFPDWEEKRLGEIATIVGGGTPETAEDSYWGGDIPWFTPTEIKSKYLQSSARMLTSDGLKSSSAKLLPIGTLLLSTRANVGDVGIARQECTTNQGFQSLIMKGKHFNEFWYQWILHNKKKFVRWAAGSTFLEINKTEVGKIKAETPHPEEQRKIADALSALDDKIAAVSDQVKHMQTFKKGLLQQMFV